MRAIKILTGKASGKRPFERPKRKWEDYIRVNLNEIGNNTRNWVDSTQYRDYWRTFVDEALDFRIP